MEKLTARHFIFFIVAAISTSLVNYTSLFIKLGGRDSWIFTIVSGAIFFFIAYYIFKVISKIDYYDFKETCYIVLGKTFGNIYILIFSLTLILVCVESASVSSSAININIFVETPIWYCLLFFIVTVFLVGKNRFNSILIVCIVSMSIVIAINLLLSLLNIQYIDYTLLLPIFKDRRISEYTLCALTQLGSLSSLAIVLPIIPKIDDKENLKKTSINTILLTCIACALFVVILISTLGSLRSSNIFYPQFVQAQRIYFGGFIENGNAFVMISSILSWVVKYIIALFSLYTIWKDRIKYKRNFIALISLIVYGFSYIVAKNVYALFILLKYYQYILLVVFFICPIIIYTLANFKRNKFRYLK
ncbi:spore gernimation protein [Clostridium perfringens]|nr:spore gernimation protein [Clostridium perfringens]